MATTKSKSVERVIARRAEAEEEVRGAALASGVAGAAAGALLRCGHPHPAPVGTQKGTQAARRSCARARRPSAARGSKAAARCVASRQGRAHAGAVGEVVCDLRRLWQRAYPPMATTDHAEVERGDRGPSRRALSYGAPAREQHSEDGAPGDRQRQVNRDGREHETLDRGVGGQDQRAGRRRSL
jgi:hypothetical protein